MLNDRTLLKWQEPKTLEILNQQNMSFWKRLQSTYLVPFLMGFISISMILFLQILLDNFPTDLRSFLMLIAFILGFGVVMGLVLVVIYWFCSFFPTPVRIREKSISYTKVDSRYRFRYEQIIGYEIREVFVDDKYIGEALIIQPHNQHAVALLIDPAIKSHTILKTLHSRFEKHHPELLNPPPEDEA